MKIPGLSGDFMQIEKRYDYEKNKCSCPSCGGIGIPWHGWFSCQECDCVALVSDGRAFIPMASQKIGT